MPGFAEIADGVDGVQRRHAIVGFPFAVVKRYSEDHGGWLGAIITYYGFFALLPLLLVFVTVLTTVFDDNPTFVDKVLDAVYDMLPFVGPDIRDKVTPIAGNPALVAAGLIVALWGATNVMKACQDTLNRMWGVPRFRRPGFVAKVARGLAVDRAVRVGCDRHGGDHRPDVGPAVAGAGRGRGWRGHVRGEHVDHVRAVPPPHCPTPDLAAAAAGRTDRWCGDLCC